MGRRKASQISFNRRVLTTFYRRLYFITRDLAKPVPPLKSRLAVENRLLKEEEIPEYRAFRPDQGTGIIASRLEAGHLCYASWYRGRIVDTSWCATGRGPVDYLGRNIVIGDGDVFIFDSYTNPRFRGFNLFMAKFSHVFQTSADLGYRRNTGVVAVENRTSATVLMRLGCEVAGLYSSAGLGPYRFIWRKSFTNEPLPAMEIPGRD